jgi:hypothetical protein
LVWKCISWVFHGRRANKIGLMVVGARTYSDLKTAFYGGVCKRKKGLEEFTSGIQ